MYIQYDWFDFTQKRLLRAAPLSLFFSLILSNLFSQSLTRKAKRPHKVWWMCGNHLIRFNKTKTRISDEHRSLFCFCVIKFSFVICSRDQKMSEFTSFLWAADLSSPGRSEDLLNRAVSLFAEGLEQHSASPWSTADTADLSFTLCVCVCVCACVCYSPFIH